MGFYHEICVFQYRKRYGLHAMAPKEPWDCKTERFNTASGMDCMQLKNHYLPEEKFNVSIPQAVWIACNEDIVVADVLRNGSFNTASGMDCMQS